MTDVENKIRSIIGDNIDLIVPIDSIGLEDDLSGLGVNSVSFIKMVVAIETEFGFEFDDDSLDFNNFKTIGDLSSYINKRLASE